MSEQDSGKPEPTARPAPPPGGPPEPRIPSLFLNYTSLAGALLILIGFGSGLLTLSFEATSPQTRAYTGILFMAYLLVILVGVIVIPIGMLRERARRRPGGAPSLTADLVIDLGRPSHRRVIMIFLGIGTAVLLAMSVGSYQTYKATDSNAFCGQLCHQVMQPEATTYQFSPHARVPCVDCHIGSGARWYVRSKISGVRQVFAVMFNTYPRPIPTPIHNLRPARETCEQCHWPQRFVGFKEIRHSYFMSDKDSTPFRIRMLLKIGGEENPLLPGGTGIHYEMLLANKVEYIARDPKRQDMAWVRITRSDGSSTEYNDTQHPLSAAERSTLEVRRMDCMDCHNRPSHKYPTPVGIVDQALEANVLPRVLPFIKVAAVTALDGNYASTSAAMTGIDTSIRKYYGDKFPDAVKAHPTDVDKTVHELQQLYRQMNFPDMKATWSKYPDDIGHRDFRGCFRCHNDRLRSTDGRTIFTACNTCHLIIAEGREVNQVQVDLNKGLPFKHPGDNFAPLTEYTDCTQCHSGGKDLYQ
jgi:nitrate/TMAO reductase-like tetraheme cytochrome c subunit